MKKDSIIENLMRTGLTKSEAVIYTNILKKQNFTASEVSKISEISRSKTYEILNQLVQKGLCVEILGTVKKYSSTNPENAFNGMIQRYELNYQKELEYKKILMSNLLESLAPLFHSEKNTDSLDYIQVIREKNSIIKKFESLERIATQEVLALVKGPLVMDVTKPYNLEQYDSLRRGVNFKTIYAIEDLGNPSFLESIEKLSIAGEEVRITNKLPMKMMIFDEFAVMFALRDKITSKLSLTAIIIEHQDIAKTLKMTFYSIWEKSMTLEEFKNKSKGSAFGREKVS